MAGTGFVLLHMVEQAAGINLTKAIVELLARIQEAPPPSDAGAPFKIICSGMAEAAGKTERIHHPGGNGFPMQNRAVIAAFSFIGMAESMAQIEQRTFAAFAFIGGNNRGLGAQQWAMVLACAVSSPPSTCA